MLNSMTARIVAFMSIWSTISIFSLTFGQLYEWPDLVHVRYGIPFTYAVNTLSTLLGPTDVWIVDTMSLAFDLALWFAGLVVGTTLLLIRGQKKIKPTSE